MDIKQYILSNHLIKPLGNVPKVIAGKWTPEVDTDTCEFNKLKFTPGLIMIQCDYAYNNKIPSSIYNVSSRKNHRGLCAYLDADGNNYVTGLSISGNTVKWGVDTVSFTLPNADKRAKFLQANTYDYIIIEEVK